MIETIQHQNRDRSSNITENCSSAAQKFSTGEVSSQGIKQNNNENTPIKHETKQKIDNKRNIFSMSLQAAKFRLNPEPKTLFTRKLEFELLNDTHDTILVSAQMDSQNDLLFSDDEDSDFTETRLPTVQTC